MSEKHFTFQHCIHNIHEDIMHNVCTLGPIEVLPVILNFLRLDSLHVVHTQAIRDGVIEATIDHEQGFMQSKVRNERSGEERERERETHLHRQD